MSLNIIIDRTATQMRPNVIAEATGNPMANVSHPHAYCEKYVSVNPSSVVTHAYAGQSPCPQGFALWGHISDATRSRLLINGNGDTAVATANRAIQGGLHVEKAGIDTTSAFSVGLGCFIVGLTYKIPPLGVLAALIMIVAVYVHMESMKR